MSSIMRIIQSKARIISKICFTMFYRPYIPNIQGTTVNERINFNHNVYVLEGIIVNNGLSYSRIVWSSKKEVMFGWNLMTILVFK